MFTVNQNILNDFLSSALHEKAASFSISLWRILVPSISENMFAGQSSEEFYNYVRDCESLLNLKDTISESIKFVNEEKLCDYEKILELRLVPQQNMNTYFDDTNFFDFLYFPYLSFVLKDINVKSRVKKISREFNLKYLVNNLDEEGREELCECIFNPCSELSHTENLEVLKGLAGFTPVITTNI